MKNLLLPFFLFCSSAVFAQFPTGGMPGGNRQPATIPGTANDNTPRGNAKITGAVIDSTTGKPVEYASVALLDINTKKPIDGTVADEKGQFTLSKVAPGDYQLLISFIGYRNFTTSTVSVGRRSEIDAGTIRITPEIKTLQEVNVVGQANIVEERVDRLVYNAERDITNRGGDATEVMRKVPMLTVDLDGNVSLRGSQNVRVLINNKPSTIIAGSVADALRQIPAEMIKSVEVITSPSARYDAEGSAGIINIITKKNTLQGLTLNIDTGVGNRGANLGLNGSYRTGKMGFTLGGFGRANYNIIGETESFQRTFESGRPTSDFRQNIESLNRGMFGSYQLGWDYDIDKNNTLTASVRYGTRNGFQDQFFQQRSLNPVNNVTRSLTYRDVDSKDLSGTVDINLDYTRTFKKPQQEFSLLTQFSRNNRQNDFTARLLNASQTQTGTEFNNNDSYNQEITIQADYQSPIGKNQMIEFGGKAILRQVYSNFQFRRGSVDGLPLPDPARPANTLDYDQNVAASYLSYTATTKNKWSMKAGLRYEYTNIQARFQQEQTLDIPNYNNLVPSVNLSKTLKGGKTVKFAYNRRLQRPGIQSLNPNINFINPISISTGNPFLEPELTDNFEIGTSTYIKQTFINATLFARRTNNSIESVRRTDSLGVVLTRPENIGRQESYGLNLFGNATILSKWQIGGGVESFYTILTNNSPDPTLNARGEGWVVSGRLFTNVTLKNGWGIQGFGFARGRQVQLQGFQGGFAYYSLGFKKDFKNKKGSVGLAAENFLSNTFRIRNELASPAFIQSNTTYLYNRGIRVNFSYRIGKMSFDQPQRRRKSVSNDDLKGDGDGGGDGGGQQPQQQQQGGSRRPRG
mgnify:CR=1 FL=1